MTADDFDQFSEWFDVLAVTHRLIGAEDLRAKMKAEYFDVLKSYPFTAVEQSYQNLRRKMKKWPVPADWLEALPPFGSVARLPPLTAQELAENDEAEQLGYEREAVCACPECRAADCFMPSRYVPREGPAGRPIERRHPVREGRPIVLGRWLHGQELKRWYASRAKYYERKEQLGLALEQESVARRDIRARIEGLTIVARAKIASNSV